MTSDIAKLKGLLREPIGASGTTSEDARDIYDDLHLRAADCIEQLEKEREDLRGLLLLRDRNAGIAAYEHAARINAESRAEAAEKLVAGLKEALRPFVIPRDGAHSGAPSDHSPVFAVDGHEITVGHFRRARKALGDKP